MANMLTRIGFIDETSIKTNMAKTTGWAPRRERLVDHAPFGHWHTQTFIAALRHDRLDAPWVGFAFGSSTPFDADFLGPMQALLTRSADSARPR